MPSPTTTPRPTSGASEASSNGQRARRGAGSTRVQERPAAAAGAGISPPPKLRRRPALAALGVALVALSGAGAAWLTTAVGHTHSVLAARAGIDRGSIITAADLTSADINPDPALHPIPAAQRDQILGRRAAVDLAAGTLLTPQSVTTATVPAAGQSLVGISLTRAQLPAQPLRQGAKVRIIDTPKAQDDPPAGTPTSTAATVVAAHPPADDGSVIVDVTVPSTDADVLAARAATGRVALVLVGAS
jgi:hypothetical protein